MKKKPHSELSRLGERARLTERLLAGVQPETCVLWFILAQVVSPALVFAQLPAYNTKYYVIHSDLDEAAVREAALRITKMFEVYAERTKGFTGKITTKLPFYLFRDRQSYMAAGGLPGSGGVYTGDRLMAVAGGRATPWRWHTIQHEGFHQFVHAVVGGNIPIWVNEGLAEYFGEALYTGDGMVTGLIPQPRLSRVRRMIKSSQFKTIEQMMLIEPAEWVQQMDTANYDQAWSMVHFLAHADDGKHQSRFDGFLRDVSLKRLNWQQAWLRNFDADTAAFQQAWQEYWIELPDWPTAQLEAEATIATLTSFLARAHVRKQRFKTADEFFEAARVDKLKISSKDWLPPSLLRPAVAAARGIGKWSLKKQGTKPPRLICTRDDGSTLTGSAVVKKGRVHRVDVK